MRRAEKEITGAAGLREAFLAARTLILAINGEEAPYLVPLSFGLEGECIYVHSSPAGRKMDLLSRFPRVSFAAVEEPVILEGEAACGFTARARSVVGRGTARLVTDEKERIRGLDAIMRHYSGRPPVYAPGVLARTVVIAIQIDGLRGKRTG